MLATGKPSQKVYPFSTVSTGYPALGYRDSAGCPSEDGADEPPVDYAARPMIFSHLSLASVASEPGHLRRGDRAARMGKGLNAMMMAVPW